MYNIKIDANSIPENIYIRKPQIEALSLFQQKIKELRNSKFLDFYRKSKGLNLNVETKKLENEAMGSCDLNEPEEDYLQSFILIFRFFIQDNEKCSISNIDEKTLPELEISFPNEIQEFHNIRRDLNQFLLSLPETKFVLISGNDEKEFKSNWDIIDILIFGHYAHANLKEEKRKWYDFIHQNIDDFLKIQTRNLFRFEAIYILLNFTNFLFALSNCIKKILDTIIEYYIKKANGFFDNKEYENSKNTYLYAITIANQLEAKEKRAFIAKKLSEVFVLLGDKDKSLYFLVSGIKNAAR